jgi:hypothetical protein
MTKRTCYRCFDERDEVIAKNIVLSQIDEADADALHDCIVHAELLDTQPDTDENLFDEPVQIKHSTHDFDGCGNDYDDLRNLAIGR